MPVPLRSFARQFSIMAKNYRFVDIGVNLGDPIFRGMYHGKQAHPNDLSSVVKRAQNVGVEKMMVTGSDLEESKSAIDVAKHFPGLCYATVGVHPCSALKFAQHAQGPAAYLDEVVKLAQTSAAAGHTVAFGEIGLDYDRFHHADKDSQLTYFDLQLDAATKLGLPLFLHMRAAAEDFTRLLAPRMPHLPRGGLVHSFTGSLEEMRSLLKLGLDIGVNGCSLKTEENLAVAKEIPLERLQIETDGPWCEIRPSHASYKFLQGQVELPKAVKKEKWVEDAMVKGRNEPACIVQVAHVLAKLKGISVEQLTEAAYKNSKKMFVLGTTA